MFRKIITSLFCSFVFAILGLNLLLAQEQPKDITQGIPAESKGAGITQENGQPQDLNPQTFETEQQGKIIVNQADLLKSSPVTSKKISIARTAAKDDFATLTKKVGIKNAKTFSEAKSKGWKAESVTKAKPASNLIRPARSTELRALEAKRRKQKDNFSQNLEKREARKAVLRPDTSGRSRKDSSGFRITDNPETNPRILTIPAYLVFQAKQGQTESLTQTFKIANSGVGTLNYTLAKGAAWLVLSSANGSVTTGENTITVTINPSGLTESGSPYIEDITITNAGVPADNRKIRVRLSLFSQDVYSQTYTYDSNNNLTRRVTPDNEVIEYKYDKLNRLSNIYYPDGKETSYEYDANGNLIKMTDWQGTTYYAYDELNRFRGVQFPDIKPVYYDYDKAGKLTKITYPTDEEVSYGYNDDNQLISVTDNNGTTTYEYDSTKKTNNLTKKTLPNGVYTEYAYDTAKRITDLRNKKADGSNISTYHYDYDANNNITSVAETTPEGTKNTTYTYDKLNRLTNAAYSDGKYETYTYDASGNRLTKTTQDGAINYEYDSDNRLIKAGNTIFFYNKSGNLIKKVTPDKTFNYAYDYNNKLTHYDDGINFVEFGYDGNGNRVTKMVNGRLIRYINDINRPVVQVLLEANRDWYAIKKYTYGLDLISQEEM